MSLTLKLICIGLGVFGLAMFLRAYHFGNQSMGRIGESKKNKS
ncbi:hypothetical protein [Polynucleobacter rarus]|jgi:hypothetical protein|nr:hypothetical protein [Polynucleobacter rarus]